MKLSKPTHSSALAGLAVAALAAFGQNVSAAGPSVFINELHYDNSSTDVGEAIEIAGPAGTDLSGWSVVLYNGSTGAVYNTTVLSGTLGDLGGGCGLTVVNYPTNGIQNGSPDGIALVDDGGIVLQFLSYEGTFEAVGGPASGLVSTDIGVAENSSTLVGESLQLAGSGSGYGDFSWAAAQPDTFGAFNTGQTLGDCAEPPTAAALNEIVVSTPGTDWEFVEIISAPGQDLSALTFLEINRLGQIDDLLDLTGQTVPVSGFFVAASPAAQAQYGFTADLAFPDNFLTNNTSTYLLVENFSGADGDDLDTNDDGVFDSTPWDAVVDGLALRDADLEDLTYASPVLGPDGSFLPAGAYYCDDGWIMHLFGSVNVDGTPGLDNVCSGPPPLVINEIHADPSSGIEGDANGDGTRDSTQDEFVELVNNSEGDLDISGWMLSDGFGPRHTFPEGTVIAPQCSIVVFGGGTPAGTFGFSTVQTASSGALGLNNGGDSITVSDGVATVVAYSYGGEGGDNQSLTRDPDIVGPDPLVRHSAAFGAGGALFSPGTLIDGSRFGGCAIVYTDLKIHDVQGPGLVSPVEGDFVAIEGIVVGDFQDGSAGENGDLNGFYVQEEDADADGDPQTSEGIFVFDGSTPSIDVAVGDQVRVEGVVTEFFGLTEITSVNSVNVLGSGNPLPTAAPVSLPVTSVDDFEWYEGMRVAFPQELFVSGNFTLARFGEVELAVNGPLDTPTNVVEPGAPALALQELNDRSRIQLEDGSTVQNPAPLPPYLGPDDTLRIGDSVAGLVGVLSFGFGTYEIQPTGPISFTRANPRPDGPPDVGPSLVTVAGFNVLNYFTTIDTGSSICGPLLDQDCRGADSDEELERQRDKILAALSILDADVVGLIEIENAPGDEPVADLVDGLNELLGAGTFDFVSTGAIGADVIRVALIYKAAAVTPYGTYAVLDSSVDPSFLDTENRPVLAQSFAVNFSGEVFTVAVNHLKSKGRNCESVGDPDTGDGQGNCNLTRTTAAAALASWLASDPTGSGSDDALIIGDLNSYAMEDPIVALESQGYVDLIEEFAGTGYASGAYSFNFLAQSGYLDHAVASPSMADAASGAAFWHINADEPVALDYNTEFNPPLLYEPNEFRSSDHDASVVGLYRDGDGDGVWDGLDSCPGTMIPESVPEVRLNVNHFALVDGDGLFDTTPPNGEGPGVAFTILDTGGCSCEQIIEEQGLGKGLRKYGCSVEVMQDWVARVSEP